MLDPNEFGKAMAAIVKESTAPLLKRIEELEVRQLERGLPGENGKDGESITAEDVAPMIADLVAKAFADAPKPQAGINGKDGTNGKDADPIDLADVVRQLVQCEEIVPILALQSADAVAKHFAANPVTNGKDGHNGDPGKAGEKGDPGQNGNDGAGVADLLIDRDGNLVATMTDGRMKSLGTVVGKDGEHGKDGADLTEITIDYDGVRTVEIKGPGGAIVRSITIPVPMDAGYHNDGMACAKGDIVTCGGNAWIAQTDTKSKPAHDNPAWRLFARKGRDAVDVRQSSTTPSAPVKLHGAHDA